MFIARSASILALSLAAFAMAPSSAFAWGVPGSSSEDPMALMGVRLGASPNNYPLCSANHASSLCRVVSGQAEPRCAHVMFLTPATADHETWQTFACVDAGRVVSLTIPFPVASQSVVTNLASEKWSAWNGPKRVPNGVIWKSPDGQAGALVVAEGDRVMLSVAELPRR